MMLIYKKLCLFKKSVSHVLNPEKRIATTQNQTSTTRKTSGDGHEDHLEGEEGHSLTRAADHQHPAGVQGAEKREREGPTAD
uniref:Uncharacterized protein n=1 Tax=Anopheles atroparvus TaxID=41427 RepID=A0AAG5DRD8_ANOAO